MELLYATLVFLIGLGVLISGAEIFIHHSAQLGAKLGISDVIVGITLVALGTSIPEIFVSISSIINDFESVLSSENFDDDAKTVTTKTRCYARP